MEFLDKIAKDLKSKDVTSSIIECDKYTFDSIDGVLREFVEASYTPIYPLEAAVFKVPEGRILIVYRGISFSFIRIDH